ncbi:hypothetical protein ASD66_06160 [Nocardioides sp. Root151]|nr:hypothetical protein ASD66_06160 [Nocardioides sp. Root151]
MLHTDMDYPVAHVLVADRMLVVIVRRKAFGNRDPGTEQAALSKKLGVPVDLQVGALYSEATLTEP